MVKNSESHYEIVRGERSALIVSVAILDIVFENVAPLQQ